MREERLSVREAVLFCDGRKKGAVTVTVSAESGDCRGGVSPPVKGSPHRGGVAA